MQKGAKRRCRFVHLLISALEDHACKALDQGWELLASRIVAFVRERRGDTRTLTTLRERHALTEFWARAPADAFGVKQELEKALAQDGKPEEHPR